MAQFDSLTESVNALSQLKSELNRNQKDLSVKPFSEADLWELETNNRSKEFLEKLIRDVINAESSEQPNIQDCLFARVLEFDSPNLIKIEEALQSGFESKNSSSSAVESYPKLSRPHISEEALCDMIRN